MPVHNAEATLPELLASLARQDCDERFEVIAVDDGSTDDSASIARLLPDVQVIEQAHAGPGAARNAGAARASAPVLAFCDADDVVHEAWLRCLCAATRRHALVAGAVQHMGTDDLMDPHALTDYYGHLPCSLTANLAVRRDVFDEVGGFTEALRTGSDADLCWRLAAHGVELAHEPAAIVFKRDRPGALPTFRQYLRYGLGHPLLFRRHRDEGMPRRSLPDVAGRYAGTAASVARGLLRPRSVAVIVAAARLGQDLGRLLGSVRWRSFYL